MFTQCFKQKEKGILVNFAKWQLKFKKSPYACLKKVRVVRHKTYKYG